MELATLIINLTLVGVASLILGIIYAIYIYHWPFKSGWTWLSVVIGNSLIMVSEVASLYFLLQYLRLWPEYWWIIAVPVAAEVIPGTPMIIGQVIKWWKDKRNRKRLWEKYNGCDEH